VYGVDADALYQTNMVECHRAFQISRQGKAPQASCLNLSLYLPMK
jgi:hypothetical protein